jgi:hypothetical protein
LAGAQDAREHGEARRGDARETEAGGQAEDPGAAVRIGFERDGAQNDVGGQRRSRAQDHELGLTLEPGGEGAQGLERATHLPEVCGPAVDRCADPRADPIRVREVSVGFHLWVW